MRRAWIVLAALIAAVVAGCGSTVPPAGLGGEGDYLRGRELFENGRYLQAIEVLEGFRTEYPGSRRIDDAIFMLGRAHQELDEWILARDEYSRLLRDYPQSQHREEAQYRLAQCWLEEARKPSLDPEPTQQAIDAFQEYLQRYPDGTFAAEAQASIRDGLDRLAEKAYLNARTYVRLGHPEAAAIYFEKSLRILSDSSKAGDALLGLARAYRKEGETEKARQAYDRLLDYATPERVASDSHLGELRSQAEDEIGLLAARTGGSP